MFTRTTRLWGSAHKSNAHVLIAKRRSSTLADDRALAGIKVVDLTRVLAGPLATMMLVSCLYPLLPSLVRES
jgi:hypothetical protein